MAYVDIGNSIWINLKLDIGIGINLGVSSGMDY